MKKNILACVIFLSFLYGFGSSSGADMWKKHMDLNLTLTQNSYSDNWAGGEAGNISWVANANSGFEKKVSEKINSKSTIKLAFGQTHQQDKDTKEWMKPFKSTDLFDFESVLRFTLNVWVDPYLAGRLESQFLDASVDQIKRYFNPIKISESAGIARVFYKKETSEFMSRLGLGLRQHINREITDTLQEKTDVKTSNDGGIESVTDLKVGLASGKISYTSKLTLFKAIFYSKSDELVGLPEENYWKWVDVNWENMFSSSITKYLTVNLYVQFLYDKEVDKKGRLKETLALGLTYKLF